MFEEPKSLSELSDYEFTNLVMYLDGAWDGSGPNPGYSWKQFFSDADLGDVPPWFDPWIANFSVEALVSLNHADDTTNSLSSIRDGNRNEIGIFANIAGESLDRLGDVSYSADMVTAEMLWPFVENFLKRDGTVDMDFQVHDPALISQEKMRDYLAKNSAAEDRTTR